MRFGVARADPSVDEQVGAFVVDHIPSVLAQDSVIHRNFLGDTVKSLHRTSEIVFGEEAIGEFLLFAVKSVKHVEIRSREGETVMLIPDSQSRSGDLVAVVAEFADRDVRRREHAAAVIGKEGGSVNEAGVGGIFQAQERRGDDREAVIAEHKRIACGSVGKGH